MVNAVFSNSATVDMYLGRIPVEFHSALWPEACGNQPAVCLQNAHGTRAVIVGT